MKPVYIDPLRKKMGKVEQGLCLSTGASVPFRVLVEAISEVDKTRVARLVFEGLARVIYDRYIEDPNREVYLSKLGLSFRNMQAREMLKALFAEQEVVELASCEDVEAETLLASDLGPLQSPKLPDPAVTSEPLREIENLAQELTKDELAHTIGVLASLLASSL